MRPQALLLIVLGLLLGPVYFAYCEYLSGKTTETHVLTDRAARWELPDGAILRLRSGLGYKPLSLEMNPDANHYRLRFTFDFPEDAAGEAANAYQASVLQGDHTAFERNFEVSGKTPAVVTLAPMEIFLPGSYVLLLEEIGAPRIPVSAVRVELRSGVEAPVMWLAWCGVVLLAAGLGLLVRDLASRSSKR